MSRAESSPGPTSSADQAFVGGDAHLGVIGLRGEHDIATVSLAATLSQTVAAEGADVVVDLREVEFMDAFTIGFIVPVVPAPAADARRETDTAATDHGAR